jgi:hypothetical protein
VVKKWAALQNAPFSAGLGGDGDGGEGGGKGGEGGGEEEAALRLGSNDLEALMMMGEDMRTCMSIGLPFSKET